MDGSDPKCLTQAAARGKSICDTPVSGGEAGAMQPVPQTETQMAIPALGNDGLTDIAPVNTKMGDFIEGVKNAMPVTFASAPFGMLFGVVAVDNGFNVWESVLMSAAVFAGASQLVGMELFGHHVAPWMILLSIFAVNFRHVLYSAGTGRLISHFTPLQQIVSFFVLTDVQYAETEKRAEEKRPVTFIWYLGLGLPLYIMWVFEAYIGATFGGMIGDPKAIGLDMLLPVYFLGLVMGFRSRTNWMPVVLASSVTSVAAYFLIGSPWHVSIGAIGGILVAVVIAKPDTGRSTVITVDDVADAPNAVPAPVSNSAEKN